MASTTDRATTTRFPWPATLMLASAGFLAPTIELSPARLLTRTAPDLNASVTMTGSLTALSPLGNAILALPLTLPAVRFSRRFSLTATLLVLVADNALVFFASDLVPAPMGRFIADGAHGLLMSLAPTVAVGAAGLKHERRALSVVIGANTAGIAFDAPLASLVGTTLDRRTTSIGAALVALVCAVLPAARDGDLVTIDAKDRMPSTHTDRYAISAATLHADQLVTIVRDPAKVTDLAERGATVRQADYGNPPALRAALEGAERLLLISISGTGAGNAHRNATEAATTTGVGHIAYTSILHADRSTNPLAPEHALTEQLLTAFSIPATMLHNAWYHEFCTRLPPGCVRCRRIHTPTAQPYRAGSRRPA
ncbi:MFS transporter [Streptomyces sp. NPDC018972]|uniref:MFS transporter n=1 Tax=Streptomyces sp. NPDC018972 TaxID=3365060 RepID=UPI0037951DD9